MKDFTREKKDVRTLGVTKGLKRICNGLIDKGVPKRKLEEYSDRAGYFGIPGSFGHRYNQVMKSAIVLGFAAFGAYLGSKINEPGLVSEFAGGFFGLCLGLHGIVCTEGEDIPLIDVLVANHPNELRQVYREEGFSAKEIDEIFERDRYQEKQDVLDIYHNN